MVPRKTLWTVSVLCGVSRAAVLRLPLSDADSNAPDNTQRIHSGFFSNSQKVIQEDSSHGAIGDAALFSYGINITVGTPPQPIKVLLDVDYSTLFVQSARCQSSLCQYSNDSVFNSSASSTYIASDRDFELVYANAWVRGSLAEDVVNVNGIDVPAVTLLDATNIHPRTFVHWYTDYHGVLGLAPGFANPTPDIPSTWETIVDNGILERNVFSISPPTGLRYMDRPRTNGELIIGSLPLNSYEESAIKLPMKFGSYAWATSLESMTFGNFTTSFASGTAAFSTVYPFIFVPYEFGKEIIRQVEQGQEFGFFRSIPCEHRSTLPDWTFGIGGQTITLNAFQYTFEITASWMDESVCAFALERSESDTAVGLGWAFWQNFDAVAFDQDEQSIFLFP